MQSCNHDTDVTIFSRQQGSHRGVNHCPVQLSRVPVDHSEGGGQVGLGLCIRAGRRRGHGRAFSSPAGLGVKVQRVRKKNVNRREG